MAFNWSSLFSDAFARSASGSLGNGWLDPASHASIASSGIATLTAAVNGSGGLGMTYRPTSDGQPRDQRATLTFNAPAITGSSGVYLSMRLQYAAGTSTSYAIGISSADGLIHFYPIVSGALGTAQQVALPALTVGRSYTADVTVAGVSPTTITVAITDNTNSTVVASATFTDSTAALQAAGTVGMYLYSTAAITLTVTNFADYSMGAATSTGLTAASTGYTGSGQSIPYQLNGVNASAVVVTPTDGSGGTFSPSTLTFAAQTAGVANPQAVTYTPASVGSKTLTTTNDSGLANGTASQTVTSPNIIAVNSAAFVFSPGNWYGDTGRGGNAYRKTWNPGAWFRLTWNASASPTITLLIPSNSSTIKLSYYLNGVLTAGVAATGNVTISGINPSAVNELVVYLKNSAQTSRWATSGTNVLQINGVQLDASSTSGTATPLRPWVLIVGDSITEGTSANDGPTDDALQDYAFLVTRALNHIGYDAGVSACGYNGFIVTGDGSGQSGDVLPYHFMSGGAYDDTKSRWNKIAAGVSALDSNSHHSAYGATGTEPALIWVNFGTNEYSFGSSASDLQAAVLGWLTKARAAAPNAILMPAIPFGLQNLAKFPTTTWVAAIKAAVSAYMAANPWDSQVVLFDAGVTIANTIQSSPYINVDGVHPTRNGHAFIAPLVAAKMVKSLLYSGKPYSFS